MRSDNYSESWYDLMHGNINSDVVVMGNSRAIFQVDPAILDSILGSDSYNLGMDGSPFNRQSHKYNIYRSLNHKPTLIIQNIDIGTLDRSIGYNRDQFFPYFWNLLMRKEFLATEPFSFGEKYVPMFRYRGYGFCSFHNAHNSTKGYHAIDRSWDGKAFMQVDSIMFLKNDDTVTQFDEYLARNKSEGINMIFVYAPLYYGATLKTINLDEMHAFYQTYADKYDIPILDYTYMDLCYDTTFFCNAMHLNRLGANIYTDSLANDIIRLGIINSHISN